MGRALPAGELRGIGHPAAVPGPHPEALVHLRLDEWLDRAPSLEGLFGFYAMLHGQGTFRRFIIASPAFWWDDRVSFEHEAAYAALNRSLDARAFFSVGMLENDAATGDLPARGYITNLRQLEAVLEERSYVGFEWTMQFFEDEHHTSVVPASFSRRLRYIYGTD